MKAQVVTAVVFTEDDGMIRHIAFSENSAEMILAVIDAYAEDDPDGGVKKKQEIDEARAVVRSANLPRPGPLPADGHYCRATAITDCLQLAEEQVAKDGAEAALNDQMPGYALCCFLRGGRHGLRLAFSRAAAKQMIEEPMPVPYRSLEPHQVEAVKGMIDGIALPFPKDRVHLDDEFDAMCSSFSQPHR
jgi:hypothetical protein